MNEPKTPAKYSENQYFVNNKKNKVFKIVAAQWQGIISRASTSKVKERTITINDWLYGIEYLQLNDNKKVFGRYYEDRITNECSIINDQQLPKAIYE